MTTHTGAPASSLVPSGDRGKPPGFQGHRARRGHQYAAGGPYRHGVHEHQCHPRFSLDTFSDSKFVIATGVSILTLLLSTVFGPLETFLETTSLDVRQWLICIGAALSIVVVSEIRKALRRRTAAEIVPAGITRARVTTP